MDTLGEWATEIRRLTGGGTIDVDHLSLGIRTNAHEESGGNPTLQDGYAALCPYVKAFPDHEACEQWAETVPAATVALPLAGATDVASALVA